MNWTRRRMERMRILGLRHGIITKIINGNKVVFTLGIDSYLDSIECGYIEIDCIESPKEKNRLSMSNESAQGATILALIRRNYEILDKWISKKLTD